MVRAIVSGCSGMLTALIGYGQLNGRERPVAEEAEEHSSAKIEALMKVKLQLKKTTKAI
jgi:hypothetical protein